ncbi:MAG: hypothetical protein ACT4P5_00560 [Armatimonadota bacterium]
MTKADTRAEQAGIVSGLFSRPEDANRAAEELQRAGFEASRVHVWMRPERRGRELTEASRVYKLLKGAVAGAALGFLLSIPLVALPLYFEGSGAPLVALIVASAHTGLAAATAGAIVGALVGLVLRTPRDEANKVLRSAAAAVTVAAEQKSHLAMEILRERNAVGTDDPSLADRIMKRGMAGPLGERIMAPRRAT